MSAGVNFVASVVGEEHQALGSAVLVSALICILGLLAAAKIKREDDPLVPEAKLSKRNVFELIAQFIYNLADNVLGKEHRKYYPFLAVLFTYLFFQNLLGLLPGFVMATDQLWINFGVATVVFVLYNTWGIKEVGLKSYLKHLWGPVLLLGPFLFCVELISHFIRPLTLSLRLFGNMTGDHALLSVFTDLTAGTPIFFVPVIFYLLGTFVCFIQAFVFTILTMIYIRLATAHDEDH